MYNVYFIQTLGAFIFSLDGNLPRSVRSIISLLILMQIARVIKYFCSTLTRGIGGPEEDLVKSVSGWVLLSRVCKGLLQAWLSTLSPDNECARPSGEYRATRQSPLDGKGAVWG